MHRTQIYLTGAEIAALDRFSRRTDRTRSSLIRQAILERFGALTDSESLASAIHTTSATWAQRAEWASGRAFVRWIRRRHRPR